MAIVQIAQRKFKVEYIGRTKERFDGTVSAYGFCNGDWNIAFPEDVLRDFFGAKSAKPGEKESAYSVLLIQKTAASEDVTRAYKRLAREWHPDVCKEADAKEQFIRIKDAYDILIDPTKRRRYDAGLAFQSAVAKTPVPKGVFTGYRTPFKCGLLTVTGAQKGNKFVASKIVIWDDIIDRGRVMVSNWPRGAKEFEISWVGTIEDPKAKETGKFFLD